MNWRTFFYWIFLWLVWTLCVYSQQMNFQDTILATVIGGLILYGIVRIIKFMGSAVTNISHEQMFSCCFVDHGPPGENEIAKFDFYNIQIGRRDHWIKITTSKGLTISSLNIRFVSANTKSSDPPTDMSQIIYVAQAFVTPGVLVEANISTMVNDGYGGIDIILEKPVAWGKGKWIFLRIDVEAKQNWSGKISFQALDSQHTPRFARADARVID